MCIESSTTVASSFPQSKFISITNSITQYKTVQNNCSNKTDTERGRHKKSQEHQELHKVAKQPGKGVRLTSQSKSIIERVRQYFEREKQKGKGVRLTSQSKSIIERVRQYFEREKQKGKGVRLTSQSKSIIERVRQYFEREKQKGTHMDVVLQRASTAIKVLLTTIKRIYSKQRIHDGEFLTPL